MDKQILFSEKEVYLLKTILFYKQSELEKAIRDCISNLDRQLEMILYYNNLIEVEWCEETHAVYQKNKDEYLANAHKWYSSYMNRLANFKLELKDIDELIKKLYL